MSVVSFHWEPDPAVYGDAILRVDTALEDMTMPLLAASRAIQADIQERFFTETAPDGTPWEQWSPQYAPIAENYPNRGILWQSGELYDAATRTEATLVAGNSVFYNTQMLPHYGLAHQFGVADRGTKGGDLPARPFLGMSDESAAFVFAAFSEWFDRSIDLYVSSRGKLSPRHRIRGGGGLFVSRSSVGKGPLSDVLAFGGEEF